MQVKNMSQIPKRYYGRHFSPGVVNYPENKQMLYVSPEVAKSMDETFQCRPLFVQHIESQVDLDTVQEEADGWVVRSFYEPLDGTHWTEFMAITDDAHEKIKDGWTLSNSYIVDETGPGGTWHNVPYDASIEKASYDHLSLVDNPRYEESIILTPEEFKAYQDDLKSKIESVKNSKGVKSMTKFFNKKPVTKLDNEKEIEALSVKLPKSGVERTISQLINEADEAEMKKDEKKMANETDVVKIGDDEVTVAELVSKVTEMIEAAATEGTEEDVEEEYVEEETIENAGDEKDKKDDKKDSKKNSKSALSLLGISKKPLQTTNSTAPRETYKSQLARGKNLY